jgi:predicted metal-dependent peptidase
LCGLEFIWDYSVDTAETDGKTFWWNPEDFMRCTPEEREGTVMHELKHVALMHNLRRGSKNPNDWNISCDLKINRDMIQAGFKIENSPMFIHDPKITAEAEEEIYEIISKRPKPPPPPPCGGGGSGQPGKSGAGKPPPGGHGPKCNHAAMADKMNVAAVVSNVVKAIQAAELAGQPGAIPGNLKEIVSEFLTPIIPWEVELKDWMSDLLDRDYTWARPNRRYPDMYLPSMVEEDGRLEELRYYIDVSGSITRNDIIRFNSELKYVWEYFRPKKLTIIQFDTKIQQIDVFKDDDAFDKIHIVGRGGTDLREVRADIIEHRPTAAIIMTDLHVTPMAPLPSEIPILWICTNNKRGKAPFGKVIHINT